MRRIAVLVVLLVLVVAGCGGKQKTTATAPVPAGLTTTNVGGTKAKLPGALVSKFVGTCTEGNAAKRQDYCGCVVQKLQQDTSERDFRLLVQAGRTPPTRLQRKLRAAGAACKSKLR